MGNISILVLEDDEVLRDTLIDALEDDGYRVRGAGSAMEAVHLAQAKAFNLVIADVRMEGMDGIECLNALHRLRPQMRSLVITGYASADAPERALAAHARDYLYKPFQMSDMLTAVRQVLHADQERASYQQLLTRLLAPLKRIWEVAGTAIASAELNSLEGDRCYVFHGLYMGIRSEMLGPDEALEVWDRLEYLERNRDQLKQAGMHLKERQQLSEGYRYLAALVGARARVASANTNRRRGDGAVPRTEFLRLYKGIREGLVSAEQLKLAPFLRGLDPLTLKQSDELRELYARLWGGP